MSCAEKRGKRYRCIINDCGTITAMKAPFTYENAMKAAIYPIANSTVDAVFWTVHTDLAGPYDAPRMWRDYLDVTPYEYICNDGRPMGLYFEKTREVSPEIYNLEFDRRRYGTAQELWQNEGWDITDLVIQGARKYGMDAWLSFRQNDMHHGDAEVHPKFWVDHPEYHLNEGAWGTDGHHGFDRTRVCYNYEYEAVREYMMAPMLAAAKCYDIDGIELDFVRHHYFFKKGRVRPEVLTEYLRTFKKRLDQICQETGKTIKIAVRTMVGVEENLMWGMDYITWAKEGLIDYIIAGGLSESPDMPIREIVDHVAPYGVLVYGCYDALPFSVPDRKYHSSREFLAASALNLYEQGADGVYFFNYSGFSVGRDRRRISQPAGFEGAFLMGDRTMLKRADKIYSVGWGDAGDYPRQLPKRLLKSTRTEDGKAMQHHLPGPQEVSIQISDDLETALKMNDILRFELQLMIGSTETGFDGRLVPQVSEKVKVLHTVWPEIDEYVVKVNGREVPRAAYLERDSLNDWAMLRIDMLRYPEIAVKNGWNTVSMEITKPDPKIGSQRTVTLERMFVDIEYSHGESIYK